MCTLLVHSCVYVSTKPVVAFLWLVGKPSRQNCPLVGDGDVGTFATRHFRK